MLPHIFSKVEEVEVKEVNIDMDLLTDNEDEEDIIGDYTDATICCMNEKLIKRSEVLKFLKTLFDKKIMKLTESKCILELKYAKYKRCYNFWNISTIIFSSSLTLIESSKLVFLEDLDNEDNSVLENFFVLSPIVLGTIITCSASIIKFKKYQEQMEYIYISIDKSIGMLSKLKNKKDEIKLLINKSENLVNCKLYKEIKLFNKHVDTLNENYKSDIIKEYASVYQETERYINFSDYNKYLKIINNIEYKKHILSVDKIAFFNSYTEKIHDLDIEKIESIKKKSMKGDEKVNKHCCFY